MFLKWDVICEACSRLAARAHTHTHTNVLIKTHMHTVSVASLYWGTELKILQFTMDGCTPRPRITTVVSLPPHNAFHLWGQKKVQKRNEEKTLDFTWQSEVFRARGNIRRGKRKPLRTPSSYSRGFHKWARTHQEGKAHRAKNNIPSCSILPKALEEELRGRVSKGKTMGPSVCCFNLHQLW